jgi:RhoGAP domain
MVVANHPLQQRIRIENGRYESAGITDPNVPASLLKYWLRDLANPLILTEYYELCIKHSEDINQAIDVIQQLPEVNRRIVLYMANFLAVSLFITDPSQGRARRGFYRGDNAGADHVNLVFKPTEIYRPRINSIDKNERQ